MNDPPMDSRAQAELYFAGRLRAARDGTYGPAAQFGYDTLADTLDVLAEEPLGAYDYAVLRQLGALDPLTVAVLDSLFYRAARDHYDQGADLAPREDKAGPPPAPPVTVPGDCKESP